MTAVQMGLTIAVCTAATMLTRFLPFVVFSSKDQQQDQDASHGGQQKAAGSKKHQTRQWGGKADQGAVVLPVLFPLVEKDHREHGGHHKVHTLGAEGQHRAHHRAKTGTGHPVAFIIISCY